MKKIEDIRREERQRIALAVRAIAEKQLRAPGTDAIDGFVAAQVLALSEAIKEM